MTLTREDILRLVDIEIKEIIIPDHIPGWGGKSLYIKQLTRGQQDVYLKRQFGDAKMRQDLRRNQEVSAFNIYGHDAWLCSKSLCDEDGKLIFTAKDLEALNEKSGEAIGWIAIQIVEFSGMKVDVSIAKGSPEEELADEIKN